MRYLITGGCGFLGTNLAEEVLRQGEELHVFDNLSRVGGEANLSLLRSLGDFQFSRQDIRDSAAVTETVAQFKPDVIFHLAGQVAMTTSIANPRLDFETNALGTLNLLEAARIHSPAAAVIYSSTNKVYGDLHSLQYEEESTRYVACDYPEGFDETTPLEFHSPYGCSKGSADQYMLDYARVFGLNTVVFRHSSIFGLRQFPTYDQGWIGWFCKKAIDAKRTPGLPPFTISGSGKQVRDVLFGADAQACYFAACRQIETARGQVFNIGGGMVNSLSLLELFRLLEELLDVELRYTILPAREGDQKVFVSNLQKVRTALSWAPTIAAATGVRAMVEWLDTMQ
jgi:CDP-paratose 2-epimerase